ncbi:TonB family protein [Kangiella sp. HD9-110m-PIT-SAG07]|nr:TonB family protein [Kangiella sp. HD9-110m-PIT-SAG07]
MSFLLLRFLWTSKENERINLYIKNVKDYMRTLITTLLLLISPLLKANEVVFPEGVESGYVLFEFDISKEGKPTNIEIIEDYPKDVFAENALNALKKWTFKVRYIAGKPVVQENMTYKMEFKVEE